MALMSHWLLEVNQTQNGHIFDTGQPKTITRTILPGFDYILIKVWA